MSQENSERIGMNCEEKALDGTTEPLAIQSAKNGDDYNEFATEIDITDSTILASDNSRSTKLERETVRTARLQVAVQCARGVGFVVGLPSFD